MKAKALIHYFLTGSLFRKGCSQPGDTKNCEFSVCPSVRPSLPPSLPPCLLRQLMLIALELVSCSFVYDQGP